MNHSNAGCVVNLDSDFIWKTLEDKDYNLENLPRIFDDVVAIYIDNGVSDIVLNVFSQDSITPTEVFSYTGDKFEITVENGIPVDYKNVSRIRIHHDLKNIRFDAYG